MRPGILTAALLFALDARAEPLVIEALPGAAVAAETSSVMLVIRGAYVSPEELRIAVEAGSVEAIESDGPGQHHARWHLPADLKPRRLAAGVAERRTRTAAFTTLSVSRRARFRVQAEPGSEIQVAVAGKTLASGRAGPDGSLQLIGLVPPAMALELGAPEISRAGGTLRETRALLPSDKLHLFGFLADPTPVAGGAPASLFLFAYLDSGGPARAALAVSPAGTIHSLGGSSFRADLAAPGSLSGDTVSAVVATASLDGYPSARLETSLHWRPVSPEVRVGSGPPARLAINVETQKGETATISVRAQDAAGNPTPAHRLHLEATAGRLDVAEAKEASLFRTRWQPDDSRVSEHVDLIARVEEGGLEAFRSFQYRASVPTWTVGGRLGVLTEMDVLLAPTVDLSIARALSEHVALVLDAALGRAGRAQTVTTAQFEGTIERSLWIAPAVIGIQAQYPFAQRWTLRAGAGTGCLVSRLELTATQAKETAQDTEATGVSWLAGAWTSLGLALGPGDLVLNVGVFDALTESSTWQGRPWALALGLGYAWGIGP